MYRILYFKISQHNHVRNNRIKYKQEEKILEQGWTWCKNIGDCMQQRIMLTKNIWAKMCTSQIWWSTNATEKELQTHRNYSQWMTIWPSQVRGCQYIFKFIVSRCNRTARKEIGSQDTNENRNFCFFHLIDTHLADVLCPEITNLENQHPLN